ncbi:hypothetical protein J7382_16560 [Shimia sp. R11_0]|uniref:hypothetical protein n=1 Tax=Shimia sp. R11_0 TaxID=2821096 RepID=UPI001ADCA5E4|nr:hypothetical protein [Shimia sp. R11_0]MBO9479158.1 hypothetical protein [Shimia sp. R11_0]
MQASKIATCCYCGTRAALVLRGDIRHELSCASCGAPLHNLKHLPRAPDQAEMLPKTQGRKPKGKTIQSAKTDWENASRKRPKDKRKKRKARFSDWVEDVFDVIEDIFD